MTEANDLADVMYALEHIHESPTEHVEFSVAGLLLLKAEVERLREIPALKVIAVRRDSPAWDAIMRSIPIKPGRVIPVTQEELDSLREDCLILDVLHVLPPGELK